MRGRILSSAASLALVLVASSCSGGWTQGDDDDSTPLPASIIGIGVTPSNPTVSLGGAVQFVATGYYSDQSTRDITDVVTWQSGDSSVITVSSSLDQEGLGTPVSAGSAPVRANFFELLSNEVVATVTEAVVTSLAIQPQLVSLHVDETVQLVAEAEFSDGSHGNVSGTVRWITSDGTIATVESAGLVRATGLGSAAIRAVYEQGSTEFEGNPGVIEVVGGEVTIDGPDVRILGLTAVASATQVDYSVSVKNSGGSPASSFWVDVWLDLSGPPGAPPVTGDGYQFVELLEAGQTTEVSISLDDVPPGSYQSWVMVDSFASLAEGSLGESNNTWGPEAVSVSGGPSTQSADLSITYLQAYSQSTQGQVLYIVDVTNIGNESADSFVVGAFANPDFPPVAPATADEQVTVPYLAAGGTAYLSITIRSLPQQWWHSYVLADAYNSVAEPNEINNLASSQVLP